MCLTIDVSHAWDFQKILAERFPVMFHHSFWTNFLGFLSLPPSAQSCRFQPVRQALTGLSGDFFEHKRLTQQVQSKLSSQVT